LSISVVIPTFKRVPQLLRTLEVITALAAPPVEIIVHVDGGDHLSSDAINAFSSEIRILESSVTCGPGGSRNRLLKEAKNEIVVSLDDDSFPIDSDFFEVVVAAIERHPTAGVIAMNIIHDGEAMIARNSTAYEVADFVGCGCIYRRRVFLGLSGYVPVQPAYGVEEADLALQLIDNGWAIVHDNDLRVRHATSRSHQANAKVTAAHISNIALLAFLRYPVRYWGYGIAQVVNRVRWSLKNGRTAGVFRGLVQIPGKLWRLRKYRRPVSPSAMRKASKLRRAQAS
jgi:GT2 family glycosyltransferase